MCIRLQVSHHLCLFVSARLPVLQTITRTELYVVPSDSFLFMGVQVILIVVTCMQINCVCFNVLNENLKKMDMRISE